MAAMQSNKSRSRFSSPRPRAASIAPPVFRLNANENISNEERLFLAAVERGDKPTVENLVADGKFH